MTKPKDDFYERILREFELDSLKRYIRQQTAEEIFKDKEIRVCVFALLPDEVIFAFPKCEEFELEVILPKEIKQKYLKGKKWIQTTNNTDRMKEGDEE